MARAVITENLGEGKYKVELRQNTAAIQARIEQIEQHLAQLETRKAELEAELAQAQDLLTSLNGQLSVILLNPSLTPREKQKQAAVVVKRQQDQRIEILKIQNQIKLVEADRLSLLSKHTDLQRYQTEDIRELWSADYSPNLGIADQEVGTIEVPGEQQEILLYPSKDQFRPWTPDVDGEMTPVIAQTPMEWLYNTCVVTGWQKYRPTYRFARVEEILNEDRMRVALIEPFKSTYGDVDVKPLNPDQSSVSYADVPCDYLDCNTAAFTVGDEVVVQYEAQNPDKPKVVGFRHDPQPCGAFNFYTEASDRLRPSRDGEAWVHSLVENPQFGNAYWVGAKAGTSWAGISARMFRSLQTPEFPAALIFHKGFAFVAPGVVHGAAVRDKFFLAVCAASVGEELRTSFYTAPIPSPNPGPEPTPCTWTLIISFPNDAFFTPFYGVFQFISEVGGSVFLPTPFFWNEAATAGVIAYLKGRSGFQLLTTGKIGDTFSGACTQIPFPVTPLEGLPDILYDEFIGPNSDDGNGNVQINTRTSFYFVGGDMRGQQPIFLTLISEFHTTQTHTETGPFLPWKGILGSGSEPTLEDWTDDRHQFARLVCEEIGLDVQLYDVTYHREQHNVNSYNTGGVVTPDNPEGLLSWVDAEEDATQTYTRTMFEHLNIGGNQPVMVLRNAQGSDHRTFTATGPLAGSDPREDSSSSYEHDGTWEWSLESGERKQPLGGEAYTHPSDADMSNRAQDIRSMADFSSDTYATIKVTRAPYGRYAADRAGHAVVSAPLWNSTKAFPILPAAVAGGNQGRFLLIGVG